MNFDILVRLRDQFTRSMRLLRRQVGAFITDLGKITGVSAAVGAALGALSGGALFVGGLRQAANFEEQLDRVASVSGATAEEIAALERTAKTLGATTRFTATEAAQGFEELTRSGQNASEAIATIPDVLRLAQANSIGLAQAALDVTTSINQFNLGVEQSTRVTDVLTKATQSSAQNIEQLTRALIQSGPVAFQAGLSIEQTAGLIGRLADSGFRGERGGTALRNALSQLLDPTTKFSRELRGLDIQGNDFVEVLDQLAQKGEAGARAIQLLGLEAAPAISSLVQTGTAGLTDLIGQLEQASGTAANAAQVLESNFNGALRSLSSAFESIRISLLQPLLAPFSAEVNALAATFRQFAASASFDALRTRLVTLFTDALAAGRQFIAEVDFNALLDRILNFADKASESLKSFGESAGTVASVASTAFDGLATVINGIRTGLAGVVTSVATIGEGFIELNLAVARRLGATDEQLKALTNSLEFFDALQQRGVEATAQAAADTKASLDRVIQGFKDTATESNNAAAAQEKLADATKDTAAALEDTGAAADSFFDSVQRITEGAEQAAETIEEVSINSDQLRERVGDQLARALELSQQRLSALAQSGDTTSEAFQQAQRDVERFTARIGQTEQATTGAAQALTELGLESQSALETLRDQAELAFRTIQRSQDGIQVSVEDTRRAFLAYAEAAITAAENSEAADKRALATKLQIQAAALGVTVNTERLGTRGAAAVNQLTNAANNARDALREVNQEAQQTPEEIEKSTGGVSAAIGSIVDQFATLSTEANRVVEDIISRIAVRGRSVGSFFNALSRELGAVAQAQEQQNAVVDELIDKYERQAASVESLAIAANQAAQGFAFLDSERRNALERIIREAERAVSRSIQSETERVRELRRELAELQGQQIDFEQQEKQLEIAELEARLRASTNREERAILQERLKLEREILNIRQQQTESEEQSSNQDQSSNIQNAERLRDLANETADAAERANAAQSATGAAGGVPIARDPVVTVRIENDLNAAAGAQLLSLTPQERQELASSLVRELVAGSQNSSPTIFGG